jgi:hypothetical protein
MKQNPPEDILVSMNTDLNPPEQFKGYLWCSKPQSRRSNATYLAKNAVSRVRNDAVFPKTKAIKDGKFWRGVVYSGHRSHRQVEK